MKYFKLILAILLTIAIAFVGYSLIITIDMDKNPDVDLATDSTIADKIETKPSQRDSLVNFAMKYLGTPYQYGSCSKDGFDCSGFVYFVFKHFKIEVPRSSSEYKNYGTTVPIHKIRKGDILVFLSPTRNEIGHLGIVTNPKGMETEFIHSSSGKEMKVIISTLKDEGYNRRFVKAISVL